MSTFGDNTPQQDILDAIMSIHYRHEDVPFRRLLAMVMEVVAYILNFRMED